MKTKYLHYACVPLHHSVNTGILNVITIVFFFFQLSAGFLIYLFSILPEILKCKWGLVPFEEALLSSVRIGLYTKSMWMNLLVNA